MSARPVVLGMAVALAACSEPTRPDNANAGTLQVVLTTPNSGADGAAVVILVAPAVPTAVTAGAGLALWGGPVDTPVDTIALTGPLSAGTILTLAVRDTRLADQYTATLRDVAASEGVALRDLTGYALTVRR